MPERHADWLEQERFDLDHARVAAEAGHFEWAAFGFDAGTPREHYTRREAEQAIADAETIVAFCANAIAR
jgi:HEPN domain-containing protein